MGSGATRVRPAAAGDLAAVTEIFAHYVTTSVISFEETPPVLADWHDKLAHISGLGLPFLVAEHDGELAGYCYATPWRPKAAYRYAAEDSVYLRPGKTGLGLGRLLLTELLAGCAGAGVRQVIAVIADVQDPASVGLHRACGFTDAGRLAAVGYKHGRWVDTILMQRAL
jgi:L-amino acid N-acyltransferase YncA